MAFGFLKKALKSAGKVVGAPVKLAAKGTGALGNLAGKIPVVGKGVKGVFTLTVSGPFKLAGNIASGARIDKAVMSHLKEKVSAVKDVAPYAQMVLTMVPGVGQGIGGAISAGLALAQGQPITQALVAGIKGALPGGPVAQAAFNLSVSAVQGKPLDKIALDALPIDPQQKAVLVQGLAAAKDVAAGKRVDAAIFNNAQKLLPPEAQKALQIGVAVAEGQRLQSIAKKHVNEGAVATLGKLGANIANSNPVLRAGAKVLTNPSQKSGFSIAMGVMGKKGLKPIELNSVRAKLSGQQRLGFDMGISAHVAVADKKVPAKGTPVQKFAFAVTQGMTGAPPANKVGMMKTLAANPEARSGATAAVKQISAGRLIWWRRLLKGMGFKVNETLAPNPQSATPGAAKPLPAPARRPVRAPVRRTA